VSRDTAITTPSKKLLFIGEKLKAVCDCGKITLMVKANSSLTSFFSDLLRRKRRLPSQLAKDIGVSHATVSRWLSGHDIPSVRSCQKLSAYSGVPIEKILSAVGYLPAISESEVSQWPEFRQYASQKYPAELDEDVITMIEDLIERRRARRLVQRKRR